MSLEAQECRGDFWLKLEEAMNEAGGRFDIDKLSEMKLKEIVDVLAQNGIRMTYNRNWHISRKLNLV